VGVILKQSSYNTIIILIAFTIGGVNTLLLYTNFLTAENYGLVVFLLSAANVLMPLTAFGVQYTIVKFFSSYKTKQEKDRFLTMALILPLFIAIPTGFFVVIFYEKISQFLSAENAMIKDYTYIIYLVAITTAYFEVFYAWSKVQMQSVFGNAVKELFSRVMIMILLSLVWLEVLNEHQFILCLTGSYFLRMFVMQFYAFKLYTPKFSFRFPENMKEVIHYSGYIILAGSASAILLDIDKVMLPAKQALEFTAYYTVGVFIASVVEAPGRAMLQIVSPLTAKAINESNNDEIESLYKRTSINLLIICGLFFVLINSNLVQLYLLIDKPEYSQGVLVVLMVAISKLYNMFLGNNGAIISNSKHYRVLLPYGLAMAFSVAYLNIYFIDLYGMNGAALSTLLVILIFNTIKLWYVKKKFNLLPFTNKTIASFILILIFYFAFHFWNFNLHPLLNIILKSTLIVVSYVFIAYKLKVSEQINLAINKLIYKIQSK
jgi:O-antigen/teichoic acid export membrane protein